jgi:glycerol transport system permease protein
MGYQELENEVLSTKALPGRGGAISRGSGPKKNVIFYLIPMIILLSMSAFVPIMTVVNYSTYDLFAGAPPEFAGWSNFRSVFLDEMFLSSLRRQCIFTAEAVLIELGLGMLIALAIPRRGWLVAVCFTILGIPLLIPGQIVGIMWRVFTMSDIGVVHNFLKALINADYAITNPSHAWWTVVAMDVWHWTPLFVFLIYAGLRAIPDDFYRAAQLDGASALRTYRFITLPKLRYVLIIGILLRTMDSFNVYSEPYSLTGGGPGNTTNFLSLYTVRVSIGAFNLGFGAALSIIYFFIVIVFCFVLYNIMIRIGGEAS